MNRFLLVAFFCIGTIINVLADNGKKLKVYSVRSADAKNYILIYSENDSLTTRLKSVCAGLDRVTLIDPVKPKSATKSKYFLLSTDKKFFSRKRAQTDCLIGAGSCLAGVVFIQAVSTEDLRFSSPSGFNVSAGYKYVEGSTACVPASLYVGGCFFGIKGIVELFMRKDKLSFLSPTATIDEVLKATGLTVIKEKEFEINIDKDIYSGVVPYILSETK